MNLAILVVTRTSAEAQLLNKCVFKDLYPMRMFAIGCGSPLVGKHYSALILTEGWDLNNPEAASWIDHVRACRIHKEKV